MPLLLPGKKFPKASDAAALVAGLLLPLAFSPFDFYPLAVIAPAILFLLWHGATPGRAAWRGFLFGLGMFGLGVSWIYVSMHRFGNMPMPLAGFATVLFVSGMSLYLGTCGWLQARFFPERATWHRVLEKTAPATNRTCRDKVTSRSRTTLSRNPPRAWACCQSDAC